MRLLVIALVSLLMLVPFLAFTHRFLGWDDDVAGIVSMVLAFVLTPMLLLRLWREKPGFEALPVDPHDPVMLEQVARARRELPRFLEGLGENRLEAYIKFPLVVNGGTEHVWGVAHAHVDGTFVTSLASTPVAGLEPELLNRLSIPIGDVEDWMLQDAAGKTFGGYTHLALARIYQREYGRMPRRMRKDLEAFVDLDLSGVT